MGKSSKPRTVAVIVQDKSGSMSDKVEATISGFNEYKQSLHKDSEGQLLLTLTQFDTQVVTVHSTVPVSEVPDLDRKSYVIGGLTALYDAVGQAIRDTEKITSIHDKVLVVVMTDGGENSSREWNHAQIMKLMQAKRHDGWEFIFLGAGEEAWATGQALGFGYTNSINYSGIDAHDHGVAYRAAATTSGDYLLRGVSVAQSMTTNTAKVDLETKAGSVADPPDDSDSTS